jgi:high-affinity iron transporter
MSGLARLLSILVVWGLFGATLAVAGERDDAARALHLLGYIGADYPGTVAAGEVVDPAEYAEQLEFLQVLGQLIDALPERNGREQLALAVNQLQAAIRQRAAGESVAVQARSLATRLATLYEVPQTPPALPDPARGEPLYASHCAACHGTTGAGDGPAGAGLEPAPANLRDAGRLDHLSLYDLFNTLGLGVQGTAMPAFAGQLDEQQRWDLAAHIAGFSAGSDSGSVSFDLATLATATPEEIASHGGDPVAFRAQRARPSLPQEGAARHIESTRARLQQSLAMYRDGERKRAYELSVAAYLDGFELVESTLNNVDSAQRKATEAALMGYRQALQDDAGIAVAEQRLQAALTELDRAADQLAGDAVGASMSFFASLLILLREGLEAILVLAAILAFLQKTGQQQARRSVHLGWGSALLAGIATWALAAYVIDVSGAQREVLEGLTALFASLVLLWVGVWMHNRRQAAAWQDYVRNGLVRGGGRFGFALLAFFAVYRELFEVILFYQTLWLQAGPAGQGMVLAGAGCALVLLVGLAWVILRGARSLPLGTFFAANAVLLCALSVVFAGQGIVALQEAGVLNVRPVAFFEFDWLGIHADAWSLGAQALVLLCIAVFWWRGGGATGVEVGR